MESSLEFKYIVYLTINIINGKFYIGVHKTSTPYKFDGYLGCGARLSDPCSYNKGKTPLHAAILKYGIHCFKRVTLKVCNTLQEALQMETQLVTTDLIKQPTNYNATIGGGIPPLLSKPVNQFDLDGHFIKTWESSAAVLKYFNSHASLSEIIKDRRNFAGYYWSRMPEININEYKKIVKHGYIDQYDINGNYIASYPSVNTASQKLDIDFRKLNMAVFRMRLCNGYYFLKSGMDIWEILRIKEHRTANRHPIYRYLKTGEFDKYFKTTAEAARNTLKATGSAIKNAVVNGWLCGGYRWSYFKADNYFDLENPKKYDKIPAIEQYDLQGNLIKIWENYKDCKKNFLIAWMYVKVRLKVLRIMYLSIKLKI